MVWSRVVNMEMRKDKYFPKRTNRIRFHEEVEEKQQKG